MANVEPWLIGAGRKRVADFAAQLRTVTDPTVAVPNLEWTVIELAQHVACLPWHFQDLHDAGEGFDTPEDWAAWGDGRRAHIAESDPAALANLVETEFEILLGNLDNGPNPRLFYGFETPPSTVAAMVVNEAVMHGRDLAQVTGAKPPMLTNAEAHAAAEATMISTHIFVDPDKVAAQPDGLYHVKFRGGKDFTWTKSGRELVVSEGKPERADAHLNTDAGMFMLSSMGRVSQVRAAFSGKMVTYGKKPWRFLGLGNTVAEGV